MVHVSSRYDGLAILLHWTIALGVAAQFVLGWWMVSLPDAGGIQARWFNLHKSLGLSLGALTLCALSLHHRRPAPPPPQFLPAWQLRAARVTHWSLYACLFGLVLAGYLGSSFSGYPVRYFGWTLPAWGWKWPLAKELLSGLHLALTWLLTALVSLHVTGALTHLVRRDGVFARMWPVGRMG